LSVGRQPSRIRVDTFLIACYTTAVRYFQSKEEQMPYQKVWSYHTGLATLESSIVDPHARIALEALVTALRANLEEQQRFESTPTIRMARAALVRRLNQFVLDHLHQSFN
jgi:hypothetical protein